MQTLKPITARQIADYSGATAEQARRLAEQYNATWAGRTWRIEAGRIIYGGRP